MFKFMQVLAYSGTYILHYCIYDPSIRVYMRNPLGARARPFAPILCGVGFSSSFSHCLHVLYVLVSYTQNDLVYLN